MALLHQARKFRRRHGPAARKELEDFLPVRNPGDGEGPRCGGPGANTLQRPASLPVQLSRLPPGPLRPHVVQSWLVSGGWRDYNVDISRGTFRIEREDGYAFDCRIPPFSLESKQENPNDPAILGN